jgi:hypothetical protein
MQSLPMVLMAWVDPAPRCFNHPPSTQTDNYSVPFDSLWESRFRSCLVDSERYALTLYRYIELNPIRVAMVDAPER